RDAVLHVEPRFAVAIEPLAADTARQIGANPRLQPEVPSLAGVRQARQRARHAGAIEVVDARHRRPVIDFVLAPDAAAEIDAPDAVGAPLEPQRLERNPDLGRPAALAAGRRHGPHRVPAGVDVAPIVGNLRVRSLARHGDDADLALAAIGQVNEDYLHAVLLAGGEVLADVVDDQRRR